MRVENPLRIGSDLDSPPDAKAPMLSVFPCLVLADATGLCM